MNGQATVIYDPDYPQYASLDQLAKQADLVIRATMTSSRVEELNKAVAPPSDDPAANPGGDVPTDSLVYTIYTFAISDCYKGCESSGDTVEVSQLGGVLNGVNYVFSDGDQFKTNKKYILFLNTFTGLPAVLLNPEQAAYSGDTDSQGNYTSVNPKGTWKIPPGQLKKLFGQ